MLQTKLIDEKRLEEIRKTEIKSPWGPAGMPAKLNETQKQQFREYLTKAGDFHHSIDKMSDAQIKYLIGDLKANPSLYSDTATSDIEYQKNHRGLQ
jgi:hypothetical protein